ncbi:MAG: sugar transferase [Chloroflexi bacterium]|nr:sugar transferase [Chloroflexota bacterium]
MFKRFSTSYMVFLYITDLILTGAALYTASVLRFRLPYGDRVPWEMARVPLQVYGLVAVIWTLIFMVLSLYNPNRVFRAIDEFQLVILATTLAGLTLAGILYLTFREIPRYLFLYFILIDLALLTIYRAVLRAFFRLRRSRHKGMTRVLIIGADSLGREVAQTLEGYRYMGLGTVGFIAEDPQQQGATIEDLPVLGTLDQACDVVKDYEIEEVVIALKHHDRKRLANLIAELQKYPVRVKVVPDFFDLAFPRAQVGIFAGIPMIGLREPAIGDFQRFVKRLFDLVATTALLLLLWPLLLVIAILIKLDSPGPIIFKQQRMGENGKVFWMYKFRSMVVGAEEHWYEVARLTKDGNVLHKVRDDPRVTRVGRWLRRWSLDELPQFFNVLKGDMSLVGPRPEMPWLVELYEPWQRKRFAVPQGMTSWWAISGRSDKPLHLHIEDDLYYIQNYSLLLDLQILWKTIGLVLKGRGAF